MVIKDLYHDSLLYEESTLAHYIFHLLQEQKISLQDDVKELDLNKADHQRVAEMIEQNILGFHPINIYSLKKSEKEFIFIFAGSDQEAIQYFAKTYRQTPMNCHQYSLEFLINRGKEDITFREMKKEHKSFPAIAGYYVRD